MHHRSHDQGDLPPGMSTSRGFASGGEGLPPRALHARVVCIQGVGQTPLPELEKHEVPILLECFLVFIKLGLAS